MLRVFQNKRVLFYFVFLLFALRISFAQIALRQWEGNIEIPGREQLYLDMPVYRGDVILTKDVGRAILLLNNKVGIFIGDKTKILIENDSSKILLKLYSGQIRVVEKALTRYQIKTPLAFVQNESKVSSYIINSFPKITEIIPIARAGKRIFNLRLKYDGSIPDGFIVVARKGYHVPPYYKKQVVVRAYDKIQILYEKEKISKNMMKEYLQASNVVWYDSSDDEAWIYDLLKMDTIMPRIPNISSFLNQEVKKSDITASSSLFFNPEEKEGFATGELNLK